MSSLIINNLPGIEDMTYLELGVDNRHNLTNIKATNKWSVDINGRADYTGTTDEWFSGPGANKRYDIIFIDANHDYDYVLRDFNNAVTRCNKWLLIHDMIPPTKMYSESRFCSDSYKLLYWLLSRTSFQVYPMDTNYGLTLIRMPAETVNPDPSIKNLEWEDFIQWINRVQLYSDSDIIKLLGS